jgi:hypothetical protein
MIKSFLMFMIFFSTVVSIQWNNNDIINGKAIPTCYDINTQSSVSSSSFGLTISLSTSTKSKHPEPESPSFATIGLVDLTLEILVLGSTGTGVSISLERTLVDSFSVNTTLCGLYCIQVQNSMRAD